MTYEKIVSKIGKLLKLAERAGTPAEAETAAAQAQALMDRYRVAQADVDASGDAVEERDEPIVDFGKKDAPLDDETFGRAARWMTRLAIGLAQLNACFVYFRHAYDRRGHRGKQYQVVGRPSDAEVFRYQFQFLRREIESLAAKNGQGCGVVWRNNYKAGCVEGVIEKMKGARKSSYDNLRAEASSPRALVRVESAIAKVEQRLASTEQWWMKSRGRRKAYRSSTSQAGRDAGARAKGRRDGRDIKTSAARGALGSGKP